MTEKPEALRLADQLKERYGATVPTSQAAAELRRQHARIEVLEKALKDLDDAYCRAGFPLTREERAQDRKRLIAARAALGDTND